MKIITHLSENIKIAEIFSEELVINNVEDGLNLMGDLYYQGFDRIIIHKKNILPEFFDLKNGIAGEILQKFSNYRIRLVIVGNFSALSGQSIRNFIFESNKGTQVNFLESVSKSVERLSIP